MLSLPQTLSSNADSRNGSVSYRVEEKNIFPKLKAYYDIVFLDGYWEEYPGYLTHLRRLTRPGSIIVTANLSPLFGGWGEMLPGKSKIKNYLTRLVKDPHFRTYVI